MRSTYRVFDSIDDVDLAAWERVRAKCGTSIFIDPRFVAAVQASLEQDYRFWYVIIYDDSGSAAACACLHTTTIDLADVADARWARVLRRMPAMLSRLRKLKVLFCGLPGSPGEKSLALLPGSPHLPLLALLDEAICGLADRVGSDAVVYKEYGGDDLPIMDGLLDRGYHRIPTQPMHFFQPSFPDFKQYCAALSSHYRSLINRSLKKLDTAGIVVRVLSDPEEILSAYTPEVHALYHQMVDNAEINIELFPIDFFRQLTSRLAGQVELVSLSRDSRIIAIGWCLFADSTYHMLYGGIDYQLNRDFDLYFNLMYATLDRALQQGASKIHVGQTASAFKARLGCYAEPLFGYVKGRGLLMSPLVRFGAGRVLDEMPSVPPADIFRKKP